MRPTFAFTLTLLSISTVACGDPCMPQPIGDPSQINGIIAAECHEADDTDTPSTGIADSDGASETTSFPTAESSGGESSTGEQLGACTFSPGTPWGVCNVDTPCVDGNGDPGFCYKQTTDLGTCIPLCSDESCPEAACSLDQIACKFDGGMLVCLPECGGVFECPLAVHVCDPVAGGCVFS